MSDAPVTAADPTEEERTWAALAHASVLLSIISFGLLGPLAAFVIWLVKRPESPYVHQQGLQAWVYQALMLVVLGAYWVLTTILSFVLIGLCLIPFGLLFTFLSVVYGLFGAYQAYQGRPFRYLLVPEIIHIFEATTGPRA